MILTVLRKLTLMLISAVFILILITGGCASVPKEVVELSYRVGQDIQALQASYDYLIHEYYEGMRKERIAYLDNEWYPRFLENWMEMGEVKEIASGQKIWSETEQRLIPKPATAGEEETLKTLQDWLDYALYAYDAKQDSLVASLNTDEMELRRDVGRAFRQLVSANATVTAHLNSLREVQEVQDEALNALGVRELRQEINSRLVQASELAERQLMEIRNADMNIETFMNLENQN